MMSKQNLKIAMIILLSLVIFDCSGSVVSGETLTERLERQTDFRPQPGSPVEQLVEVAQKFKIPMAIEWLEPPPQVFTAALTFRQGTVLSLLEAIVRRSPEHRLVVTDAAAYVSPPAVTEHPFNFLNLRVSRYRVINEPLLGAEYMLRHSINALLYPELYKHGFGGGYGSAPGDPFWEANVTVSGDNLTIRETLTRIAVANGNALWVVRLKGDEFEGSKPHWDGVPIDEYGNSPLNTRWKFIPLDEKRTNKSFEPATK
jgi:hypothetical protein